MKTISTTTKILSLSVVLILIGYLLMAGPGSTEQQFCADIFSVRRIRIAPLFSLTGYLLIIIGIIRKR